LINFILSIIIFTLTLITIIFKPFNKKEYFYVLIFTIIAFIFNIVNAKDALLVINNIWNAVFSLISIMIISSILDEIGLFRWAALTIALAAEGKGKRLFILTTALGSLISIFFNNDGTILILTPIIYEMVSELGFKKVNMIPFLFACGFIADTASVPLVVSNLANIVSADTLNISFEHYFSKMFLPGLSAIFAVTLTLYFYFRTYIPTKYNTSKILHPDEAVKDWGVFNVGLFILFFVVLGYFVGTRYNVPVSTISVTGAAILLYYSNRKKAVNYIEILNKAPWDIIIFAFGMYMIVYGLYKNGLNDFMANALLDVNKKHHVSAVFYSGILSTFTACTMNNLPSVMIGAFSVNDINVSSIIKEIISFSSVIGNDVGAKITPFGSLATILWMDILKSKELNISWNYYIKSSFFIITPPLIISLIVLSFMF
jgi:arsenical pump membrane protein